VRQRAPTQLGRPVGGDLDVRADVGELATPQVKRCAASGSAKGPRQAKQAAADAAAALKRGKPGRPPGMSLEKAAAIVRHTEKVIGINRAAGGWTLPRGCV
jgi:hypothetical protein